MIEKSVAELDIAALMKGRKYYPSPESWEDQTLYFLLIDRFSDGNEAGGYRDVHGKAVTEGKTSLFDPGKDENNAVRSESDAKRWREAGGRFVGGNIKGLTGKLGYLKRLGVTAIWVSPVWKQCLWDEGSYHGYGTQNFLDIDPRFGTREDLKDMVETAHHCGIRVILDIIINHAGNVFAYDPDAESVYKAEGEYPIKGWRDKQGKPTLPFGLIDLKAHAAAWPEGAVWPTELQLPGAFSRKGEIRDWDAYPECVEGDFFALKDLNLGTQVGDHFEPSSALKALTEAFKFWIAYADLDGFRMDSLKHTGCGASQFFCNEIRNFARSLGKKSFYIFAEVMGDTAADSDKMITEFGVDGGLWLGRMPVGIRDLVTGRGQAAEFFDLHRASTEEKNRDGDMSWFRSHYVGFFDDHDLVGIEVKKRFVAEFGKDREKAERAIIAAVGLTSTSLGFPCLYYGTEQGLDGHSLGPDGGDIFVREAMFGGEFGSRGSRERHFFNEKSHLYREIAAIFKLRSEEKALRRGGQFLREVSRDGKSFGYPGVDEADAGKPHRGIIAWSRIEGKTEVICALNTDPDNAVSTWVTVDATLHKPGAARLRCLYSSDPEQIGTQAGPPEKRNGSAVCLTIPPGGFAVFK